MADEGEVDVLGDFDFKLEYVSDGIIISYACRYFPDPSLICDSNFYLLTRTGKMFNCTAKLSGQLLLKNGHTQVQLFKKKRKQSFAVFFNFGTGSWNQLTN